MLQLLNPNSIYKTYIQFYLEHLKNFGKMIAVLMRVGDFYEIYDYKLQNFNYGNADSLSKIMNCNITKKCGSKKHSLSNPRMMGIPYYTLDKYITILNKAYYTIAIYEQKDIKHHKYKKRYLDKIISPGTNLNTTYIGNTFICSIYIEIIKSNNIKLCGLSFIDVTTGENFVNCYHDTPTNINYVFSQIIRILHYTNPKEIIIFNKNLNLNKDEFINNFNINENTSLVRYYKNTDLPDKLFNIIYQKKWLQELFKEKRGMLDILDYLGFNTKKIEGQHSYIVLLYCINKYYIKLVKGLNKPKIDFYKNQLMLENTAIRQLNILNNDNKVKQKNSSLFDIINFTKTNIGYRILKYRIANPELDKKTIEFRYNFANSLKQNNNYKKLNILLKSFPDFERLHRKLGVGSLLTPKDFFVLDIGYNNIIKFYELENLKFLNNFITNKIKQNELLNFIKHYNKIFNIKNMNISNFVTTSNNIFNVGISKIIDKLYEERKKNILLFNKVEKEFNTFIRINCIKTKKYEQYVKIKKNKKNKYLEISQHKYGLIQKHINKFNENKLQIGKIIYKYSDFKFIKTNKFYKICHSDLDYYNIELIDIKIQKNVKKCFTFIINKFYNKYSNLFNRIVNIVGEIDFAYSNAKCSTKYFYSTPQIISDKEASFIDIKDCRHPIIEQINKKEPYKPFDIKLDNNKIGLVLSAINAAGKSSLLKSAGLMVVMAQMGYHVPCSFMKYNLFNKIMTRIEGNDNIFTGTSSYQKEMKELRNILNNATPNSLVLIDELCRGTETKSSIGLTVATIEELSENLKPKFILTTHLHEIFSFIKNIKNILIKHISIIQKKDGTLIYNRKLKDGPSPNNYGIMVAQAMKINLKIISRANKIKDQLSNLNNDIIVFKNSKYNKNKIIKKCYICHISKNLHIHHIKFQNKARKDGFFNDTFWHKNNEYNLISLCQLCHQKVHKGLYKIELPIFTSNGYQINIIKKKYDFCD